ncbi:MAG: glycine oxidase [Parvicellaceae bacterium]|jgi:glycine oxidase
MQFDVLIVGQGLAGTVLGEKFLQEGKSVYFIDQGFENASSVVAAGMYNPVVFKRVNKSWMVDEILPVALDFYHQFSEKLKAELIYPHQILKFFANEEYRKMWVNELGKVQYLGTVEDQYENKDVINDFGFGRVTSAGRVVLKDMLTLFRDQLKSTNCLLEEKFDYDLFTPELNTYKGINYERIVFCQGHEGQDNNLFNWLPLQTAKGELLHIHAPNINSKDLLNKGFFILPIGDDNYVLGSTYSWKDKTNDPTDEGKEQVLEKFKKLYKGPFKITKHTAGIRPTVSDRRPLVGWHPEYKNIGIFNGLGAKGVMLAPYFADQLVASLDSDDVIHSEVDIQRFN